MQHEGASASQSTSQDLCEQIQRHVGQIHENRAVDHEGLEPNQGRYLGTDIEPEPSNLASMT